MKITIGDAGEEAGVRPRWLVHLLSYTPQDQQWSWVQHWLGIGQSEHLRESGWGRHDLVHYRTRRLGPLWCTTARLRRGLPPARSHQGPANVEQLR